MNIIVNILNPHFKGMIHYDREGGREDINNYDK